MRCIRKGGQCPSYALSSWHSPFDEGSEKQIRFEGYEILKGLEGNAATHDHFEILPIAKQLSDMKDIL
jgi:hypothetical protein